jgi:hypothetical protein
MKTHMAGHGATVPAGGFMAATRYGHLIKPLGFKGTRGRSKNYYEANNTVKETAKIARLNGQDHLEGLGISLAFEYHDGLGAWYGEDKPHTHRYPEIQFIVGLDTAAINYLGADVEYCLGNDMKTYQFSEPTVVVVPEGVPHGPVTTTRMYSTRGYACYRISLTATPEKAPAGMTSVRGKTLARLVKPLKPNMMIQRKKLVAAMASQPTRKGPVMSLGPGNADHLAWFYGKDLEGLSANMDWGFFSSPGLWHRGVGAHVHRADEVLVFVGTDPSCPGSLGADIEIDIGKEHERLHVTEPSVVVMPRGVPHGPFVTHWVDRPFAFFSVNLAGDPGMKFVD